MATKIDIEVGIIDATKAGLDSIAANAKQAQQRAGGTAGTDSAAEFAAMAEQEAKAAAQAELVSEKIRQLGNEISLTASKSVDLWQRADEQERLAADIRKVTDAIRASGDQSKETQAKLTQLVAQEKQLGSSVASLRQQSLGHEAAARAATAQTQGLIALAGSEGLAAQEAAKLAKISDNVTAHLDSAAVARHRDELAKLANQYRATGQAAGHLKTGGASAGQAMLQLGYAVDDVQYGMRGIVNNIPLLVSSLGGGAGLAGVLAIIGVLVNQIVSHAKELGQHFGFLVSQAGRIPIIGTAMTGLVKTLKLLKDGTVELFETTAAVMVNLQLATTKGVDAAIQAYRRQIIEYNKHKSQLEAIKDGTKSVADAQKEAAAQTLKHFFDESDALDRNRDKLLGIEALLRAGGHGSRKTLGDLYDPKDAMKNIEHLKKMQEEGIHAVTAGVERQRVAMRELAKNAASVTAERKREHEKTLELISANKELSKLDAERAAILTGDAITIQVQQAGELRRITHERMDIEQKISALGRGAEDDNQRANLLERVTELHDEALRLINQQGDAAARLRGVDEARIRAREEADKRLAGEEGRSAKAVHDALVSEKEDKAEIARLQYDSAQKARQANQSGLEESRQTAKRNQIEQDNKRDIALAKELADSKQRTEARLDAQRDDNAKKELARIDMLKAALMDGGDKSALAKVNDQFSDTEVRDRATKDRRNAARNRVLEDMKTEGKINQHGNVTGHGQHDRQRNVAEARKRLADADKDVRLQVFKEEHGIKGQKVDEGQQADARANLLRDVIQKGGLDNIQKAAALKAIDAELARIKDDIAKRAAQSKIDGIAEGLMKPIKKVIDPKTGIATPAVEGMRGQNIAEQKQEAAQFKRDEALERFRQSNKDGQREAEKQEPLFFDEPAAPQRLLPESSTQKWLKTLKDDPENKPAQIGAGRTTAGAVNNMGNGLANIGKAQGEADGAIVNAMQAFVEMTAKVAEKQVQLHDVVTQITQHVNQLQQQFLAADNAAMLKAQRAGAV